MREGIRPYEHKNRKDIYRFTIDTDYLFIHVLYY